MSLYDSKRYMTIYQDDDYMVWVDAYGSVVNIFFKEKGLTLHFSYEDFQLFRDSVNNIVISDMDEDFSEVCMEEICIEEKGVGLYFNCEEFHTFVDILNTLRIMPKWLICLN